MITRRTIAIVGAASALVIGAGVLLGTGAANGGDGDAPLAGTTLARASAAALAHAGGGVVTETARGDDGAAYEVEVRRADGSQVEVRLGRDFTVIGEETDDDGPAGDEVSEESRGLPQGGEPVTLDPADFSTAIDNPYLPMRPGSRWVYRETDTTGRASASWSR